MTAVAPTTSLRNVIALAAAYLASAIGITVLAGWAFDVAALRIVFPGSVPMMANTAVALILAGAALGFTSRRARFLAAAGVFLLGGLTLVEYVAGWNIRIDELLFRDPHSPFRGPGRMAFTTAASFVVLGLALLFRASPVVRRRRAAEILGGIVALFALFEVQGHFLGASGIAGYSRMALPTALVLTALSIGTIAVVSDGWLVARITESGPGGILTRRLLPVAVILPVVLGVLGELAKSAGWLDAQSGVSSMVSFSILLLLAAGVWSVATVDRIERRRLAAEAVARETEDRFRWFFEEAPIGKIMSAPDGRLLRVNHALCDMLGYSPQEMQSALWMSITHPEDLAPSQQALHTMLAGKIDRWEMEKRYRAKDGRWVWTRVWIGVHRDADGTVSYFLTHVQDISDSKRAAERLQERERQLVEAQTIAHVGSWEADLATNLVTWSDEAYRIFGVALGTTVSYEDFVARIHPEDRARIERIVSEGITGRHAVEYEWRLVRPDGDVRHMHGRNVCVLDGAGQVTRLAGTSQDITERKRAEEALRAALLEVKTLRGYLRICANCHRVLAEDGTWEQLEAYVRSRTEAEFSHGICPDCAAKWADSGEFKVPKRARS